MHPKCWGSAVDRPKRDTGMNQTKVRGSQRLAHAVAIALGLLATAPSVAQDLPFDLPEEDAALAIPEFARQANLQILAPASKLTGIRTHAVRGKLDPRAALKQLL